MQPVTHSAIMAALLIGVLSVIFDGGRRPAGQEVLAAERERAPTAAGWSDNVPRVPGAHEHFVGPQGMASNPGTREAPWDLASALAGTHPVASGDVIWVRGGTYQGQFAVKLTGKDGAPIHVRAYPGERATVLNSTLFVTPPASHVWLWDLELTCSHTRAQREIQEPGSSPKALPADFGDGLNVSAGTGCKYINLVIHDTRQGISFWIGGIDSEVHGCLIYDNGWKAPDRGHGHCIYTQNRDGIKTISQCILSALYPGAYTMHAYGSERAYVDNYRIEDNIAYQEGPFLIGGGRPSHHIQVFRNQLFGIPMRLGYGAQNEDCELRDNIIAKGSLTISKFQTVVEENNLQQLPERKAVLIPNKYDPRRAHLAIYNGAKAPSVAVDVTPFLKAGDGFRLLHPKDFFGKPVLEGRCRGATIRVPMTGEFAAFVLVKEQAA
jgi:hypothetical protein